VPSLDLRFADNKSLVDATTGSNLVTFTRASSGTFVGSDGVIRTAVTNLLLRSEEFDQTWSLLNSSSITADQGIAPNGTNTADLYTEAASGFSAITQSRTLANAATYTASVYLKKGTSDWARVIVEDVNTSDFFAVYYDINTGQVGGNAAAGTGLFSSASIIAVGSGWYRVVLAGVPGGSSGTVRVRIHSAQGNNNSTRNFNSTTLLWGAQLEQSSTVGEYIPTTSTINSAPRFDHNPTTGESLGLLVEEQRTNSIRNNTGVGAVAGTPGTLPTNWLVSGLGTLTQEVVGIGTQNGINYIDLRFSGTVSTSQVGIRFEPATGAAGTNGQTFTFSAWTARVSGSTSNIGDISANANIYNSGGSFVTSLAFTGHPLSVGTTFARNSGTGTIASATAAFIQPQIYISLTSGTAIDFTIRIGLPQLEQGAFATSVIPTSTTAVTRSADVASISGSNFSGWYRQDEGTVFSETQWAFTHTATVPSGISATWEINNTATPTNNYCLLGNSATTADQSQGRNSTAGIVRPSISGFGFKQAGVAYKTAFSWNPSVLQHSTNSLLSTAPGNTVAALMATHDRMLIGQATGGSAAFQVNGTIRRLTYWPTRLSNSTLQAITQ
jgi:hypothetical protein